MDTNNELRLPFGLLQLELMCRRNILHRELLHNALVWRYFTTHEDDKNSVFSSVLRYHFTKLNKFFEQLAFIVEEINDKVEEAIKEDLSNDNKLEKFFENYIKVSLLLKKALEKLDFFHHKAYYLLESFPPYFPNPNVFRIRQELKAYEVLEQISSRWLEFFKNSQLAPQKLSDFEFTTQVYWECDPENLFIQQEPIDLKNGNKQINFLFKGSYYIVNCPSLWILLSHEALHFILKLQELGTIGMQQNETYERLRNNFLIEMEALKHSLGTYIDPDLMNSIYEDTMCDAILTNLLGECYYTALWRIVFGFDEAEKLSIDGSVFAISISGWWIRLYVCANILRDKSFTQALEKFHAVLMNTNNSSEFESRILAEQHIADRLIRHAVYLVKKIPVKLSSDDELRKLKNIFDKLSEHLKNEVEGKNRIEMKELREGRIFSSLFLMGDEVKEVKDVKDINVVLLRFIKLRLDGYNEESLGDKNTISAILEVLKKDFESDFIFLNLGNFQLTSIRLDFHDKDNLNKDILIHLLKGNNTSIRANTFLETCIQKNFLFFSYEITANILFLAESCKKELTPFPSSEDIKKFFKNCKNVIIAITIEVHRDSFYPVKYKINEAEEMFKKLLHEKLKIEIWNKALIGQCFGWPDFLLILELNSSDKSYLKPIQKLKNTLHQIDEIKGFKINRTFTSVMIPPCLFESDYKITSPDIIIRYSSFNKKPQDLDKTDKIFPSPNWKKLLLPGIFDTRYRYTADEISIHELYNTINKIPSSISDLQFRINIVSPMTNVI